MKSSLFRKEKNSNQNSKIYKKGLCVQRNSVFAIECHMMAKAHEGHPEDYMIWNKTQHASPTGKACQTDPMYLQSLGFLVSNVSLNLEEVILTLIKLIFPGHAVVILIELQSLPWRRITLYWESLSCNKILTQSDRQLFYFWRERLFVWTLLTIHTAFIGPFLLTLHICALETKGLKTIKTSPRWRPYSMDMAQCFRA